MKKQVLTILVSLGIISKLSAQTNIPAFPGAEGSGTYTKAGRGGRIIEVTNLNNAGTGSFRAACEASGARIVVFRVAGIIELLNQVVISNPYITIAGQTAPSGGITLSGRNSTQNLITVWNTHDVVIRYLRLRKGYNNSAPEQSGSCGSIQQDSYNIVFDHCSFSWTQDENNTIWNSGTNLPPREITFSWNITSEPLKAHPTSIITGGGSGSADKMINIDFHHNLITNSSHRNPLIKSKSVRWINNIVYNWGYYATQAGGGAQLDVINNFYKAGPLTNTSRHEVQIFTTPSSTTSTGSPSIYIVGNKGPQNPDPLLDNWKMVWEIASENASESTGKALSNSYRRNSRMPSSETGKSITIEIINNLEENILKKSGAYQRINEQGEWVEDRDDVDKRIVQEYINNQGFIPENETQVGGFPNFIAGSAYVDSDKDGMSNVWETKFGFNPNSSNDSHEDADNDGYTNVEEFLNGTLPKENVTKIEDIEVNAQVQISLNPANGELYLLNAPIGAEINICDVNGRVLITEKISSDNQSINISELSKGIYLAKVGEVVKKINVN